MGAIEGEQFDVVAVEYRIEPYGEGEVEVLLATTYELSTPFNWYARWWLDLLLRDFQNYILDIVKLRSESVGLAGI